MSISEFFQKAAEIVAPPPPPTQYDLTMKAVLMAAQGAAGRPRRPKRNLHLGPLVKVGEIERDKKGGGREIAPLYYQSKVDASRYPKAHDGGGQRKP